MNKWASIDFHFDPDWSLEESYACYHFLVKAVQTNSELCGQVSHQICVKRLPCGLLFRVYLTNIKRQGGKREQKKETNPT